MTAALPLVLEWPLFVLFGAVLGMAHFSTLAWHVRILSRRPALVPALALPASRLAIAGGGLTFAALHGAGGLFAALAGLLVVRAVALRLARGPS